MLLVGSACSDGHEPLPSGADAAWEQRTWTAPGTALSGWGGGDAGLASALESSGCLKRYEAEVALLGGTGNTRAAPVRLFHCGANQVVSVSGGSDCVYETASGALVGARYVADGAQRQVGQQPPHERTCERQETLWSPPTPAANLPVPTCGCRRDQICVAKYGLTCERPLLTCVPKTPTCFTSTCDRGCDAYFCGPASLAPSGGGVVRGHGCSARCPNLPTDVDPSLLVVCQGG